jgi:hypothetical protein
MENKIETPVAEYMSKIGKKGGEASKRTDMGKGSEGQRKAQEGRKKKRAANERN